MDSIIEMEGVTRLEYIEPGNRLLVVYAKEGEHFEVSLQDEGRTVKIFLTTEEEK